MGEHVHVRVWDGLSVSEGGELVEQSRCRCGATWSRSYRADDGPPEK